MTKLIRKRETEQESQEQRRYTPRGTLVAIGLKVQQKSILEPIRECVQIGQKVIKYTPFDKLRDCLLTTPRRGGRAWLGRSQ